MNDVIKRTIWGAVFIVIMVAALFVGEMATAVILGLFMLLGVFEFYRFFSKMEAFNPFQRIGILGAIAIYVTLIEYQIGTPSFNIQTILVFILFVPFLGIFSSKNRNHLVDISLTVFPWLYVTFSFYLMFVIYMFGASFPHYWQYLLGLFVLVWTNDTLAYCTGRLFGKHKLYEKITPKKTWEGAIGGFIFTIVFGFIYAILIDGDPLFWMLAGMIVSPTSIIGDLIESRFKRIVQVKDSGTLIPGHGGVLDRFDAVIYAAPFFYLLLLLF